MRAIVGLVKLCGWLMLLAAGGCFWIDEAELAERFDRDGDGVPRPEDCDDDDAGAQVLATGFEDRDGDGAGDPERPVEVCGSTPGVVTNSDDCDDTDDAVNPGATEVCDGIDNDCSGAADEGLLSTFYVDGDGDGAGDDSAPVQACSAPTGTVAVGGDCNDGEAQVGPGAPELCDTIDNDCDGLVDDQDPGLDPVDHSWFFDADSDGYGDPNVSLVRCTQPSGYVANDTDCADQDPAVSPAALEVCNGIDDDCDGSVDQSAADAATFWADADSDGVGDSGAPVRACTQPSGTATSPGDCDDGNADVFPGGIEVCNGIDDDCDTLLDDDDPSKVGGTDWFRDGDGDGFGSASFSTQACVQPSGFAGDGTDCDDADDLVFPGGDEVCDGIDNDCDGDIDDADADLDPTSTSSFYADDDGDGFGQDSMVVQACAAPAGHAPVGGDCDDTNPTVAPGAVEQCDGLDNDCNGLDDDNVVFSSWYPDSDGDGVGDTTGEVVDCLAPPGHVGLDGDCDDTDPDVSPLEAEECNGFDDDCDSLVDDADPGLASPVWHRDLDADGFGDPGLSIVACAQPSGFVADATDCGDANAAVNPSADEVCDGLDNDCDLAIDDADPSAIGLTTYTLDRDGDGFGDDLVSIETCVALPGYVVNGGDCDDLGPMAASIFPDADVTPADVQDGLDRDCDGTEECFVDGDDDGFGNLVGADDGDGLCDDAGEAAVGGDCDDGEALASPGGTLVAADGIDNDCNGFEECHVDLDGDMFGSAVLADDNGDGVCTAAGESPVGTDCDDSDATTWPGAPEQCDGVDNDCDGDIDDGVINVTWYEDSDSDGFGGSNSQVDCAQPVGFVAATGDCNDADDLVFPGAGIVAADVEDGVDRNCDGFDECFFDGDGDGSGVASFTPDDGDGSCDDGGESATSDDCDDSDATVVPGAPLSGADVDDGIDRDCDGFDECFSDVDGDDFGSSVVIADSGDGACNDAGESLSDTDCDDGDATVNPDASVAVSDIADGVDRDCNGFEECASDGDGDGFGVATVIDDDGDGVCDANGEAPNPDDCDDGSASTYPGAPGIVADGTDQDCDGREECYADGDSDTFGSTAQVADDGNGSCTNAGESANSDDCDDTNGAIFPGAPGGVPEDGVDQDCDGLDECFVDADLDGFAGGVLGPDDGNGSCVDAGEGATSTDCRDTGPGAASTYPGAPLVPADVDDGVDRDCDGLEECFADGDADGFGDGYLADDGDSQCDGAGESALDGDCDDADPLRSPGLPELCANSIDDDCDGDVDSADGDAVDVTFYADLDGDLYGDDLNTQLACDPPVDHTLISGDCDDTEPTVNPDGVEVCNDGLDNDCDGGPGVCLLTGDVPAGDLVVWLAADFGDDASTALAIGELDGVAGPEIAFGAPGWPDVRVATSPFLIGGDLAVDVVAVLTGSNGGTGTALAVLPDADGDGDDELLVGAPSWRPSGPPRGAVFVVDGPVPTSLVEDLPARLLGAPQSETGTSLAVLGDFYGVGSTVVAVGASGGVGAVHLVSDPQGLLGDIDTLADDTITGLVNQDAVGESVARMPDTNNDGRPELVIGAPGRGVAGEAYVFRIIPGVPTVDNAAVVLSSGTALGGTIGEAVGHAGDLDDDGNPDLAVVDGGTGPGLGTVYLVDDLGGSSVELDGVRKLTGATTGAQVLALGDLDGDGVDDLAVGDPGFDGAPLTRSGRVSIFFGPILADADLSAGDIVISGEVNQGEFGASLAMADLDNDGRGDLVIGSPGESAAAYILAGTLGL